MKKITVSLSLVGLLIFGCNNASKEKSIEKTEVVSHENHEHSEGTQGIELNKGEKWQVNAEMIPHVLAGEKLLNDYKGGDYKKLAEQMDEKNTVLIQSCTMDGKSHEELHKWLHPHIELLASLGKAENEQTANAVIEQLKASFKTYHIYFQ